MIGPHEGKELELMLTAKKHLAIFHDIVPKNGTIAEEIIPDRAFAPHVQAGQIIRRQKEFIHPRTVDTIRYVCFALPTQTWRIDTIFWIKEQTYSGRQFPNNADDIVIGKLLGYSEEDIAEFIYKDKAA